LTQAAYWVTAPGHGVKLVPPTYVKPYVKSQKNGAADAEPVFEPYSGPACASCPSSILNSERAWYCTGRGILIRQPASVSFLIGATGAGHEFPRWRPQRSSPED
jgi:hypothetical protein